MMKRLFAIVVPAILVVVSLTMGTLAQGAGPNWLPSSDYCGLVWHDPARTEHNGFDIWTSQPPTTTGFNGSMKGYPVQLVQSGVFRQFVKYGTSGPIYGLRFYHPALNKTTFYWHMAPHDLSGTYVETTLVVGTTYPAGTFLGYQGDLTGVFDTVTHVHVTVANGDVSNESTAIDPSAFFGVNLNGAGGGSCYGSHTAVDGNQIRYQAHPLYGPMPSSISRFGGNYPNNSTTWYTIVNPPGAPVTRAEFSKLWLEPGFDHLYVYQFNTSNQTLTLVQDLSGHYVNGGSFLSSAVSGRIMFLQLVTDGSVTDIGFEVSNYHDY
jgi:hypothetical protein